MLTNEIKYGQKKKKPKYRISGFFGVSQNVQKMGKYVAICSRPIFAILKVSYRNKYRI